MFFVSQKKINCFTQHNNDKVLYKKIYMTYETIKHIITKCVYIKL